MTQTTHLAAPGLATLAVRGGLAPDPVTGAILTPIYQSTTFVQPEIGRDTGYTYSRSGNPTVAALERNLAALEGVDHCYAFATGMAALTTLLLARVRSGDHVVLSDVVYGGTVRLLRQVLDRFGVETSTFDGAEASSLATVLRPETRLVLVETPANPTLKLVDIVAVAKLAHRAGALLAVDNTLLTPILQRPFELGADVVAYSTTKYLEGHNATVGGALLVRDAALAERLQFVRNATGCTQAPWEAWLTLRGLKTLELRMARHCESALRIARWLEDEPRVARVLYPGLQSFPQQELAQRQVAGGAGGGMISFELRGGLDAARRFVTSLRRISLAESLGAAESLITHPASMTHATIPVEERRAVGISDGLVRLSVGLETAEDLIGDLAAALQGIES